MADMPGVTVQPRKLEEHLGLPVVLMSGKTGMGLPELIRQIGESTSGKTSRPPAYYKLTAEERALADRIRPVMPDATDYALLQLAHHADWLEHLDDDQRNRVLGEKASAGFHGIQAQISETLSRYSRFTPV